MPSEKAIELVREYLPDARGVIVPSYNQRVESFAERIDELLTQARLEGVRLGLEAAAEQAGLHNSPGVTSVSFQIRDGIRALDPQQVINESMGE